MRRVFTTAKCEKRLSVFIDRHPELTKEVQTVMELIAEDAHAPSLRVHRLKGMLSDFYAARISAAYRIVFALEPDRVIFLDVGSHDEVYR